MKISTAKLKQLIREELFYREFYTANPINESVGGLPAEIPIVRLGSGHFGAAHIQAFEEGPPDGIIALLNNDSTFTILEKTPEGHRGISTGTLSVENPGDYPAASTVIIDPGAKLAWAGTLQLSDLTPESIAKIGAPANRYAAELQGGELNEQDEFPEVEPHDPRQLKLPIGTLHPDQLAKIKEYSHQLLAIYEALEAPPFDALSDPASDKHDSRMDGVLSDFWDVIMDLGHIADGSGS